MFFDMSLPEEERTALDAEVWKMEERNARASEAKPRRREVRKPVMRKDLLVEETHVYPEGVNLEDYTETAPEVTSMTGWQSRPPNTPGCVSLRPLLIWQ